MSLLTLLRRRALAALKSAVAALFDTSNTNNLGADGFTWAQAYQPTIDQYGKIVTMVQIHSSGLAWIVSNDSGDTWADLASSGDGAYPVPVVRMAMAYDSENDKFHVLYAGLTTDGMIYRRYAPTRDVDNNITAMTKDANTNLQLDFNADGTYQHPILFWCSDIGTEGALVAIWTAHKSGGGTEVRASMRVLSDSAADGVAGNWTHLGVNSSDAISMAPAVAYTALHSSVSTNGGIGWQCVLRKSSSSVSHAKDLCIFYVDLVTGVLTWRFRRMAWNAGSSNWSGGLSTAVSVGSILRAGVDGGYSSKYQLGSKPVEDTTHDLLYFAYCDWKDNTNGDTWLFKSVNSSDVVGSAVDVYSGLAANMHADIFVTGDIAWDATARRLVVAYTDLPNKDIYITNYDGSTQKQTPLNIFSTAPADIPIIIDQRIGNKTIVLTRDFNVEARENPPTYTPPYVGYWIPVTWG